MRDRWFVRAALLGLVLSVSLLVGCDKKEEAAAEEKGPDPAAVLKDCLDLRDQLKDGTIDFQEGMSKMMAACGEGCDLNPDSEACTESEKAISALCGVDASICGKLCGTMDSKTLNDLSCNFKP